jgi:hypothetical protein
VANESRNGSFRRARIAGITVILGLLVFITVIDAIDAIFFDNSYEIDGSYLMLIAGLTATFLGAEVIGKAAEGVTGTKKKGDDS